MSSGSNSIMNNVRLLRNLNRNTVRTVTTRCPIKVVQAYRWLIFFFSSFLDCFMKTSSYCLSGVKILYSGARVNVRPLKMLAIVFMPQIFLAILKFPYQHCLRLWKVALLLAGPKKKVSNITIYALKNMELN